MSYRVSVEPICNATTGVTQASNGLVASSTDNQTGNQLPVALTAAGTYFTAPIEVKGRYATFFVQWIRGGATQTMNIAMVAFGADARLTNDYTMTLIPGATPTVAALGVVSATNNPTPLITGRSFPVNLNGTSTPWSLPAITVDTSFCVGFDQNSTGTGSGSPIPGRFFRLLLVLGVAAAVNSTLLRVDVSWSDATP